MDPIGSGRIRWSPRDHHAGLPSAPCNSSRAAQDFARFGLLYLRDGVWDGQRLLPEGWVDYARRPTFQQPGVEANRYGAHWWLDFGGPGSFSANGYDGQFTILVPDRDLVIVRHGATPLAIKDNLKAWIGKLAASLG